MSPAARRLAIRLLYGAFVLSEGRDGHGTDNAPPVDLLPALSAFLDYSEHERASEPGLPERMTSGMVFALYAVSICAIPTLAEIDPLFRSPILSTPTTVTN